MWTNTYEKIIRQYKTKSFVSMWLQLHSGYYYRFIGDLLTYPIIVISSISSAALFGTDNYATRQVIASLSILNVILMCILVDISPNSKSETYISNAKNWQTLIRNMDQILFLPDEMRPDPCLCIEKICNEADNINESEDIVPRYIIHQFEKRFGTFERLIYGNELMDILEQDIRNEKRIRRFSVITPAYSFVSLERLNQTEKNETEKNETEINAPGGSCRQSLEGSDYITSYDYKDSYDSR